METDCLIEGCGIKQHVRGICRMHYLLFHREISEGRLSWEQLEEFGMAKLSVADKNKKLLEEVYNKLKNKI